MADLRLRFAQISAFILVPFIVVIIFQVIPIFHAILTDILPGFGGNFYGVDLIVTLLSLFLFGLSIAGLYWWVAHGAPGLFSD